MYEAGLILFCFDSIICSSDALSSGLKLCLTSPYMLLRFLELYVWRAQVFKREPPFPKESSSSSEEYEVISLIQSALFDIFEQISSL